MHDPHWKMETTGAHRGAFASLLPAASAQSHRRSPATDISGPVESSPLHFTIGKEGLGKGGAEPAAPTARFDGPQD